MFADAYDLIDANPNATRVLATEAASLAYRYLSDFLPAASWRLLGVEYDTGDGKVDLAWVHDPTGVVFFDEVKTSRVSNGRVLPPSWLDQARRYSTAGVGRFGDAFLGTRLIPVMAGDMGRLVLAQGTPMLLAPTNTALHDPTSTPSPSYTTPTQRAQQTNETQRAEPVRRAQQAQGTTVRGSGGLRLVHSTGGVR